MKTENKKLVLVAEDHPVSQELFSIILEKFGYGVLIADNGQDAVEKAELNNPSLIFMDLQMPVMDGYKAATCIREKGFEIPIIAVTGRTYENERKLCRDAGMNDVLVKPFKQIDIEQMLKKWMDKSGSIATLEQTGASSFSSTSVFNAADALDSFMNNEETLKSLLYRYILRTEEQLSLIADKEKNRDWDGIRKEAHLIKGAALTLSGSELGHAASILEKAAKDAVKDEIEIAILSLNKAFERFKTEAEKFILSGAKCP